VDVGIMHLLMFVARAEEQRDSEDQHEDVERKHILCLERIVRHIIVTYERFNVLTSTLLRFDQPCCAINANNQTSSNFGIQSAAMTRFFDT
jgi:hypothetical protein